MPVLSGLEAIAWSNPDDGVVVQVNKEDFAADAQFDKREITPEKTDVTGGHPYTAHECIFNVPVWNFAGKAQLDTWVKNRTRINAFAAGVESNVQWYERDRIKITKQTIVGMHGDINKYTVQMKRTYPNPNIWNRVNLLSHLGWEDKDGNGVADNYLLQGTNLTGLTFIDDVQHAEGDTSSNRYFTAPNILFPVEGVDLRFSFGIVADNGNLFLESVKFAADGSIVATESAPISGVGRKSISTAISPAVMEVQPRIKMDNAGSWDAKFPSLRVDGSDQYVNY